MGNGDLFSRRINEKHPIDLNGCYDTSVKCIPYDLFITPISLLAAGFTCRGSPDDMSEPAYTAVPPNEDEEYEKLATRRRRTTKHFSLQAALYILSLIVVSVGLGFGAGWEVASSRKPSQSQPQIGTNKEGSLSPQSLIPQG